MSTDVNSQMSYSVDRPRDNGGSCRALRPFLHTATSTALPPAYNQSDVVHLLMFSSSNIGEFSKDVRMLAALEDADSDGDKLLEAARRLAGAFSELLTVAQPGSNEVNIHYC